MTKKEYNEMSKEELLNELKESEEKLQIALTQIVNTKPQEKKVTRTFSLTDSEITRFETVAKQYGYKNRSQFLSYLIKKL